MRSWTELRFAPQCPGHGRLMTFKAAWDCGCGPVRWPLKRVGREDRLGRGLRSVHGAALRTQIQRSSGVGQSSGRNSPPSSIPVRTICIPIDGVPQTHSRAAFRLHSWVPGPAAVPCAFGVRGTHSPFRSCVASPVSGHGSDAIQPCKRPLVLHRASGGRGLLCRGSDHRGRMVRRVPHPTRCSTWGSHRRRWSRTDRGGGRCWISPIWPVNGLPG